MSYVLHLVALMGAFYAGWIINPAQRRLRAIQRYKDSL